MKLKNPQLKLRVFQIDGFNRASITTTRGSCYITCSDESANLHQTSHPTSICQRACGAFSIRRSYRFDIRIGCPHPARPGTAICNNTTDSSRAHNQRKADSRTKQTITSCLAYSWRIACISHHRSISPVASALDFIHSTRGDSVPRLPC